MIRHVTGALRRSFSSHVPHQPQPQPHTFSSTGEFYRHVANNDPDMIRLARFGGAIGGFFWPHPIVSATFTVGGRLWMNGVVRSATTHTIEHMKVPPKLHTRQCEEIFYNFSKFYMYGSLASIGFVLAIFGVAAGVSVFTQLR